MPDPKKSDPKKPRRRSGNEFMAANGYAVAAFIGVCMVVAGGVLAAIGTPEAAFVWTGAVLLAVAVVGDRLLNVELGREGGKITLAEKKAALEAVIENAPSAAPVLGPGLQSLGQGAGLSSFEIVGSYWSQPALDAIATAYGSNSRRDFNIAVGQLEEEIAAGTAVVNVANSNVSGEG
jgi:hypothetical protein